MIECVSPIIQALETGPKPGKMALTLLFFTFLRSVFFKHLLTYTTTDFKNKKFGVRCEKNIEIFPPGFCGLLNQPEGGTCANCLK